MKTNPKASFQVNKCLIKWSATYEKWQVCRNGKVLEEFKHKETNGEQSLELFNKDLEINHVSNSSSGAFERQLNNQKIALKIYRWWKYEKPKDEKEVENIYSYKKNGKYPINMDDRLEKLEQKIYDDENNYLIELMKIRNSLWH